jgi:hypothetical protein
MLTRLRRESRDARKNRYSARRIALSTKSVMFYTVLSIFFVDHAKRSLRNESFACFVRTSTLNTLPNKNKNPSLEPYLNLAGTSARNRRPHKFLEIYSQPFSRGAPATVA